MSVSRTPADWLAAAEQRAATIADLRSAAAHCRACELWKRGTQTVFGEGAARPRLLLVGEQPGDQEDRAGRPFVGPAGKLLDRALERAGIDRGDVWVTNAVKHFKWKPRGKRRIHEKPSANEVRACRPWLLAEIAVLAPDLVVCLGATAAQSLLGREFRVTEQRGELLSAAGVPRVLATVHPASLLRAPDEETRTREIERFVADLRRAAAALAPAKGRAAAGRR
jgi:uracil-DNA glycosylase family protein